MLFWFRVKVKCEMIDFKLFVVLRPDRQMDGQTNRYL